jgi:hypothetical protein
MTFARWFACFALAGWVGTGPIAAQSAAFPLPDAERVVMVSGSLEPHLVLSVGFLNRIAQRDRGAGIGLGAGVRFPPHLVRSASGRIHLMGTGGWSGEGPWEGSVTSYVYLSRNRNRAGTMHGIGVEVRAQPGHRGERWSAAADLGWQGTLATRITHGPAARDAFEERYPEGSPSPENADGPVDGWYRFPAQRFRVGVTTTRALNDRTDLQLGVGALFNRQRQGLVLSFAHAQVPAYVEAGLRAAW